MVFKSKEIFHINSPIRPIRKENQHRSRKTQKKPARSNNKSIRFDRKKYPNQKK